MPDSVAGTVMMTVGLPSGNDLNRRMSVDPPPMLVT